MKLGILGSGARSLGLMAMLGAALANPMRELANRVGNESKQSRKPAIRRSNKWYRRAQVKTSWPGQTEAQRDQYLEAAAAKRQRKSEKLCRDLENSFGNNYAHWPLRDRCLGNLPKRCDPFYVAK